MNPRSTILAVVVAISAVLVAVNASPIGKGHTDPGFEVTGVDSVQPPTPDGGAHRDRPISPAVANLDAALLGALRAAAADAGDDGVELTVNSGWRSADYQEQLLQDAIAEYGSEEEAARWVATPETSVHVSGDAVDIGPSEAASWLSDHGSDYGLCQIYDNEPWHFELRPDAADDGCPSRYADPTQDPRMQH